MGPIQVVVEDGNNLVLEVTPTPNTTVILDRGIAGPVGPMGDGDVDGPASSTDNAVARFDGTTGKLIQNSLVTVSDTGAVAGVTTLAASGAVTLSGGTANGVAYLNGSKVLTTGSALTFDGSTLYTSGAFQSQGGTADTLSLVAGYQVASNSATNGLMLNASSGTGFINFRVAGSEQMRLTSTGLGIGTSSPTFRLDVQNSAGAGSARIKGGTSANQSAAFYVTQAGSTSTLTAYGDRANIFGGTPDQSASIFTGSGIPLLFDVGGTTKATLNSSGQLETGIAGTASAPSFTRTGDTNTGIFFPAADTIAFAEGGVEAMRLDSSGNLGIGTSSPNKLLTLNSVTNDVEVLRINAPGGSGGIQAKADIGFSYFDTAAEASAAIGFEEFGAASTGGILLFKTRPDGSTSSTRPTERMRLDQVGNLGLGVAPSAWNSAYPTMQIGLGASITGVSTTADAVFVAANTRSAGGAYNSGTYLATAAASYYRQLTGAHSWHTAPSGTAGTAITFTQAMTLDASGRLQLGTTTSGGDLTVYENTSAANKVARFVQANSSAGTLGAVEIVSAVTGGSALDVAQWNNASGSWIQRWYENASRDVGDSISTTATFVAGINTDGNFGIGTSSPAAKLDVVNASGRAARIGGFQLSGTTSSADGGNNLLSSGAFWNGTNFTATQTTSATVQLGNGAINFYTESGLTPSGTYSGTVRATIDSSGNLGLGVTPSAWGSLFKAIQVGDYASFSHNLQNAAAIVASNAYNNDNTNWRYLFSSVAASRYEAGQGQHRWFTAPSGTAGNAITFTQAMTLDASGNLGVGTTSPTSFGAGFVNTQINGTTGSFLNLSVNGTRTGYMYSDASGTEVGNLTNGFYRIFVNGSERARIDTSGNLLVGLTSATGVAKLQVSGAIRTTGFTVATLPAGTVGMRTYVTDALAPSFGVTVSGGGAVTIPVFHNGTNWIVA